MLKLPIRSLLLAGLTIILSSPAFASGNNYNDTSVTANYLNTNLSFTTASMTGNTGVGTSSPQTLLAVLNGNVGIGTWTADGGNLIVNGGGNVGISTAWPGTALDINGSIRMKGFQLNSGPVSTYVLVSSNASGLGAWTPPSSLQSANGASPELEWNNSGTFNGVLGSGANTSGNIGIGTSASANILDVNGGVGIGTAYAGYTSASTNGLIVQGNVGIGTFKDVTSALSVMNAINVGIGTWAPAGAFEVNNATSSPFLIDRQGNVGIGTTITGKAFLSVMNGDVGIGTWQPAGLLQVGSNLDSSFIVSPNGNVGIGTVDTSGGKLIVMGGHSTIQGYGGITDLGQITVEATSGSIGTYEMRTLIQNSGYTSGIDFWVAGNHDGFIGYRGTSSNPPNYLNAFYNWDYNNEDMIFNDTYSGTSVDRMKLDRNGNVGIGTVSPKNSLDVNGASALGTYAGNKAASSNGLIVSGNMGIGTYSAQTGFTVVGGNVGIGTWTAANSLSVVGGLSIGPASYVTTAAPANGMIVAGNVGIGTATAYVIVQVVLNSGTSWTVPSDWSSSNNTIELIGGGGAAYDDDCSIGTKGGAGGGGYVKNTNVSLTVGNSITYKIGAAGVHGSGSGNATSGGDTIFNSAASSCGSVSSPAMCAQGGGVGGLGATGGTGGGSTSVGTLKYTGGTGGAASTDSNGNGAGGGGGGAAGPNGAGKNGGAAGGSNISAGGGGGNGGGSVGAAGALNAGGTGGNNASSTGGGAGGSAGTSYNGVAGTVGGGGGGATGNTANPGDNGGLLGGNGGSGIEWGSAGSGGGGGGATYGSTTTIAGGQGGLYGGGGGGAGDEGGCYSSYGGNGGQGVIVITYQSTTMTYQGALTAISAGLTVMGNNVGIGTWVPGYTLHVIGNAGLSGATAWTSASDIRLKDIRGDYTRGLNEIMKLHTVRYRYKKNNALGLPSDKETIGFIAQEVQKVIPEAVGRGPGGYLNLNVDPIHWAMVNAIRELDKRWEAIYSDKLKLIEGLEEEEQEIQDENDDLAKENRLLGDRMDAIKKRAVK